MNHLLTELDARKITQRFLQYVTIDTQSDPNSSTTPSTAKQWDLARKLARELKEMGLAEVTIDDKAYVMATIPSNVDHKVPVIGFISHFDTTPDYSGTNVSPRIIENYDGEDIVLNREKNLILSPSVFQELKDYKGMTLITTDGNTLLGADDKAGITEIMSAAEFLMAHPEIKHGTIRIGFTPDEEIGRGAHHFDVKTFGAEWAYTMDGSQLGELEYENFNAASATLICKGKSVHPGYAKGKMINSVLLATEFLSLLPKKEVPQYTEHRQGFFHFPDIQGSVERTEVKGIIRDHDRDNFEARKSLLQQIAAEMNERYERELVEVEIKDQYYNMKEKVEPVMHIVDLAKEAMESAGITPLIKPIRGGTDGSQLSYMGLPCPNIFAGGHNFHGPYEYIPVESMVKATEVIIRIASLAAAKYHPE